MRFVVLLLVLILLSTASALHAKNCAVKLEGNDQVRYDQRSITVNASCDVITVELKHTGGLPLVYMGHNVVIAASSDVNDIAREGIIAGTVNGYLKGDDARVIAHTEMIGGGRQTSMSFPGNKLTAGGDYSFFCSLPGHPPLMRGQLVVEP